MIPRVLIRHLTGSQAHRVDQFPLAELDELTLGRSAASSIRFDGQLEDMVSRHHAAIRVVRQGRLSFRIADLGSSNGVQVNGKPVVGEQDLRADDLVELGPGGPAFRLAVEPAGLRPVEAADAPGGVPPLLREPVMRAAAASPGVNRPASRRRRHRLFNSLALCTLAVVAGGGVVLLGSGPSDHASVVIDSAVRPRTAEHVAAVSAPPRPPPVATARAPLAAAPGAVVSIEARWRLYDEETGKPVFQKILNRHGQHLPGFVEMPDGRTVPWLTTEDEDHTNAPIGGVVRGSGFIVGRDGRIITSRRVAAGWTARSTPVATSGGRIALFRASGSGNSFRIVDPQALSREAPLTAWSPGGRDTLFYARSPTVVAVSGAPAGETLEGRNESLDVLLPATRAHTPARLVMLSPDADVAELRIDVGYALPAFVLAPDTAVRVGEHLSVPGYPGEAGASRLASVPGTVLSLPGQGTGSSYRLSMDAGAVTQGAPVIADDGAVLGIVTTDPTGGKDHALADSAGAARALLEAR